MHRIYVQQPTNAADEARDNTADYGDNDNNTETTEDNGDAFVGYVGRWTGAVTWYVERKDRVYIILCGSVYRTG